MILLMVALGADVDIAVVDIDHYLDVVSTIPPGC